MDVSTRESASNSIAIAQKGIDKVSEYRSRFGATQNRLEHAKLVDDNESENTQASESKLRDTDMAKEMVSLSISNVLEQTGISMLAQANQAKQRVVELLQI